MIVSLVLLDFNVDEPVYLHSIIFDHPLREVRVYFTAPANAVDPLGLGWW
jgi:hypothetical protein